MLSQNISWVSVWHISVTCPPCLRHQLSFALVTIPWCHPSIVSSQSDVRAALINIQLGLTCCPWDRMEWGMDRGIQWEGGAAWHGGLCFCWHMQDSGGVSEGMGKECQTFIGIFERCLRCIVTCHNEDLMTIQSREKNDASMYCICKID